MIKSKVKEIFRTPNKVYYYTGKHYKVKDVLPSGKLSRYKPTTSIKIIFMMKRCI